MRGDYRNYFRIKSGSFPIGNCWCSDDLLKPGYAVGNKVTVILRKLLASQNFTRNLER